jgi:hypothetical protein
MPVSGGTTRSCGTALAPAQEGVALLVAAELDLAVQGQACGVPNSSTCTEWSMTSSAGKSGLTRWDRRPSAHGLAHGRQVHHRRHPGEVLQDHPRRHEGDLGVGAALGSQLASALMWAWVTVRPSSVRSSISSSTAARRAGG